MTRWSLDQYRASPMRSHPLAVEIVAGIERAATPGVKGANTGSDRDRHVLDVRVDPPDGDSVVEAGLRDLGPDVGSIWPTTAGVRVQAVRSHSWMWPPRTSRRITFRAYRTAPSGGRAAEARARDVAVPSSTWRRTRRAPSRDAVVRRRGGGRGSPPARCARSARRTRSPAARRRAFGSPQCRRRRGP